MRRVLFLLLLVLVLVLVVFAVLGCDRASLLDHVVATPGLVASRSVEVHSFCRDHQCRATTERPPAYVRVTDHCPVTFDVANAAQTP